MAPRTLRSGALKRRIRPACRRSVAWAATTRGRAAIGSVLLAATAVGLTMALLPAGPALLLQGIAEDPCVPQRVLAVPATVSGHFEPGSSVLRTGADQVYAGPGASGKLTGAESACVTAAMRASQGWLRAGLVPGDSRQQRSMATRELLDLRLSVRPNGAVVAGWRPIWQYAWPRDSSWVAVALADTDHLAESFRILRFLQRVQSANGTWAARYWPNGSGPVLDGRPSELDAVGWIPWAVWSWFTEAERAGDRGAPRQLGELWPMVAAAADAAARSLTRDGLPVASTDYWEDKPIGVTLGTAAPLLAGLRAAADMAAQRRDTALAGRWASAAARLSAGIQRGFGSSGFHRAAFATTGADAAITFLGPPLAAPSHAVLQAARAAQQALQLPNGGLRPGTSWPGAQGVAWTPETALFALFDEATGQPRPGAGLLSWLAAHQTRLGELPEQVSAAGRPVSVAPLAWTDAVTLLALLSQSHQLPIAPVPAIAARPANSRHPT